LHRITRHQFHDKDITCIAVHRQHIGYTLLRTVRYSLCLLQY